ncbi:MAG TPA: hypothetical protein PK611_05850, partial [Saprospiraceae bacterium]|nr:hypothetical protein [Saprospiraceae bacterium]
GPTSFCPGASVSVGWTGTGTFNTGNEFRVQISNASGVFPIDNSSNVIGFVASTALTGTVTATIPGSQTTGTGYRMRVVSTDPAMMIMETISLFYLQLYYLFIHLLLHRYNVIILEQH